MLAGGEFREADITPIKAGWDGLFDPVRPLRKGVGLLRTEAGRYTNNNAPRDDFATALLKSRVWLKHLRQIPT